jgi:hypothetical protein
LYLVVVEKAEYSVGLGLYLYQKSRDVDLRVLIRLWTLDLEIYTKGLITLS